MKYRTIIILAICCSLALMVRCSKKIPNDETGNGDSSTSKVIKLSDANFDLETANGIVLVYFWATWCGPCKIQGPIVEKVAQKVQGSATIAKLDVDANPKIAKRYNITFIPTLVVFKDGKDSLSFVGVTSDGKLIEAIKSFK